MDLHLLCPDELEVECRVRNLKGNPTDVIIQLENALKLEDGMPSLRPYKMHTAARKKPNHEIKKCSAKLSELKLQMENINPQEIDNLVLRRLETRFIHLKDRLHRAQLSPTYCHQAKELYDTAQTLLLKTQSVMQDETHLDQTLNELKELQLEQLEQLSESDLDIDPPVFVYSTTAKLKGFHDVNSTPIKHSEHSAIHSGNLQQHIGDQPNIPPGNVNTNNNIGCIESSDVTPQPTKLRKYMSDTRTLARSGISYDGSPTAVPIDLFLFQLETLAKSLNLSEELLFTEICFVLKGNALRYYWTYRRSSPNSTWLMFRNDLIERFKDRRTEFELRRLVESRKQHKESFLNFYNDVWSLTLQCKKHYSEEDLIDVLRLNMHPALQLNLTDKHFENVQELIKSATAWETTWARLGINPDIYIVNKKSIHELQLTGNPNSSYQGTNQLLHTTNQYPIDSFHQDVAQLNLSNCNSNPSTSRGLNQNQLSICFNCDDIGHTFHQCSLPRKRFCYKCGFKNVTVTECPNCAGNASRDQMHAGNLSTPISLVKTQKTNSACNTDYEISQQKSNNGKSNQ